MRSGLLAVCLLIAWPCLLADAAPAASYRVRLAPGSGDLVVLAPKGARVLATGPDGLWTARMLDGATWRAADFQGHPERSIKVVRIGKRTTAVYRAPEIAVTVTLTQTAQGADVVAHVRPTSGTLVEFSAPARLVFSAESVRRMVFPSDGNQGVGVSLDRSFFMPQPLERPAAWHQESVGSAGYVTLFGGPLDQRADQDGPTALTVTDEGRSWLGADVSRLVDGARGVVNRPSMRDQVRSVLVDSANGPWLSGSSLGGRGMLWRVGGAVGTAERPLVLEALTAIARRIVAQAAASAATTTRPRIGVVAVRNGPEQGGWAAVPVKDWLARLGALGDGVTVERIETHAALLDALGTGAYAAILNPYGEWMLSPADQMPATVAAVGAYVRRGGHWLETGGYPFHYALAPARHLSLAGRYPPMFADFAHLDAVHGSASVYGVRPPTLAPWSAAQHHASIFVPGTLGCGSLPSGGYLDRAYAPYVGPGTTWRSPVTRISLGSPAEAGLASYARANGIDVRLSAKVKAPVLDKLVRAPLVYVAGTAAEKTASLGRLPVPTLLHWADYLHGGFDKQYPDHLPPRPEFGSPAEYVTFLAKARRAGHLTMPYTNGTWWCDHPRGPTFLEHGEAPLLRTLKGDLSYERYGDNDGYTVTHWHPAVRAANRKTRTQFAAEYPVDIVFQDQNAARSWAFDTNPASPTPHAYIEGLLSNALEDSRVIPLSTEGGWDRMANAHAQLCGMAWGLVPTEGGPEWRRLMKETVPPSTWEVYPLAQRLAHDKCLLLMHNLGQFVTNRETLAWNLGLGFQLSATVAATQLASPAVKGWVDWLARLQRSVGRRAAGHGVRAFRHERGGPVGPDADGTMTGVFGPVRVAANLGPEARVVDGHPLAPYGFHVSAAGMVAGALQRVGPNDLGPEGGAFVSESSRRAVDVWFWARAGEAVAAELPVSVPQRARLVVDGAGPVAARVAGRTASLTLPADTQAVHRVPEDLAGRAPRDWSGNRPSIGVLDFAHGPVPLWTRVGPSEWLAALRGSRLASFHSIPVHAISTVEALMDALEAGPRRWLMIVNPYGEAIPQARPGGWRDVVSAVRDYVRAGGTWWETGGYTFHAAFTPDGQMESSGPGALATIGLSVGGGEVLAPEGPIEVTAEGRALLGDDVAAALSRQSGAANRGLPRGIVARPHETLLRVGDTDYVGGYGMGGWGRLWRFGGFWPRPEVLKAVVLAVAEKLYVMPPVPPAPEGPRTVWHARITW